MVKKTSEGDGDRRVLDAITGAGVSVASVAEAADISEADFRDLLRDEERFTLGQLARVGGFLRIRPSVLVGGGV